ncbi:MAG: tetratricopeptide repeat protein [Planctomyces sp.]|nr:tetratricopeptide repeat protein [Planctomyces sp.]
MRLLHRFWYFLLYLRYEGFPGLFRLLAAPIAFVRWLGHSLWGLFLWWWETRKFRYLLFGLPALLVFSLAGYFAAASVFEQQSVLAGRYLAAGERALENGNYEAARLYLERAVDIEPGNQDAMWKLAMTCQKTEDAARLLAILKVLAPDHQPVHAPAHALRAVYFLNLPETEETLSAARQQLNYALRLVADDPTALWLLGQLDLNTGNYAAAVQHLSKIAAGNPAARLPLAKSMAMSQDMAGARRWAEDAAGYWSTRLQQNPGDVAALLGASETLMFLERYQEAAEILRKGLQEQTDDRLKKALSRTLVMWADSLSSGEGPENLRLRYDLLSSALLVYPNDLLTFDRMMALLKSGGDVAAQAREFLLDNIAQGRAVGISHLILGSQAFFTVNPKEAELHLERALESAPQAPIVANNLAWFLAHRDPPDLERALALIEPVVAKFPEDVRFLDTRGHVLAKMGQHREAIQDLEKALKVYSGVSESHAALAECYAALGHAELAARHEQIARRLRDEMQREAQRSSGRFKQ